MRHQEALNCETLTFYLLIIANSSSNYRAYNAFHPVVDGTIITDYPSKLILEGKFAQVPLIVGYAFQDYIVRTILDIFPFF